MIRTPLQGCGVSRAHCTNATSTDLFRSREMKAHRGSVSSRRVSGWPNIISRAHRSHTGFAQTAFRRGCEAMPLIEVSGATEVCGFRNDTSASRRSTSALAVTLLTAVLFRSRSRAAFSVASLKEASRFHYSSSGQVGSARTTDVSTWRSDTVQYRLRRLSFCSGRTTGKPCFS